MEALTIIGYMLLICALRMEAEEAHSRQKRAPGNIPNSMEFNLAQMDSSVTTVKIGDEVRFQLNVTFPSGAHNSIQIEIFSPNVNATFMHILSASITRSGSNLSPDLKLSNPTYYTKDNEKSFYSRAMFSFNTITNSAADTLDVKESQLSMEFKLIMVPNSETTDGEQFLTHAGVLYNNEEDIWIGQITLTASVTNEVTSLSPQLNISGVDQIEVGSSAVFQVEILVPQRHVTLDVEVVSSYTHPMPFSVCDVRVSNTGSNLCCLVKESFTSCAKRYVADRGTWFISMKAPNIVNMREDVNSTITASDAVRLEVVISVFSDTRINTKYPLHLGIKMNDDSIWTIKKDFLVIASSNPTSFPSPTPTFVWPDSGNNVTMIAKPSSISVDLFIPSNLDNDLELQINSPVSTTTLFSICNLRVLSVGSNIACKPDTEATYTSVDNNFNYNEAKLQLGRVTNKNTSTGDQDSIIKIEVIVTAVSHAANVLHSIKVLNLTVGYGNSVYSYIDLSVAIGNTYSPPTTVKPDLSIDYVFGNDTQNTGALRNVLVELSVTSGQQHSSFSLEVITPYDNSSSTPLISIQTASLTFVGRNIPCINMDAVNKAISYSKRPGGDLYYRAAFSLNTVCNINTDTTDVNANKLRINVIVRFENSSLWVDGEGKYLSAGMTYDSQSLEIMQLIAYSADPGSVTENTQYTPFFDVKPAGPCKALPSYPTEYIVTLKIPPQSTKLYNIEITTSDNEVTFCNFALKELGKNVVYSDTKLFTFSVNANKATASLGSLTNPYMARYLQNVVFDDNTITFSLIIGLNRTVIDESLHYVSFKLQTETELITGILNITATTNESSVAVMETDSDETASNIAPGETRRLVTEIHISNTTKVNKVAVHVACASTNNGRLELVSLGPLEFGSDFLCFDRSSIKLASLQERIHNGVVELGSLQLGYMTLKSIITSNSETNKISVESNYRLDDDDVGIGGQLHVAITVALNDDKNVTSTFTWNVQSAFTVPLNLPYTYSPPENYVKFVNATGQPFTAMVRRPFTLQALVKIPPLRAVSLKTRLDMPVNKSAIIVINSIKAVCAGVNIASMDSVANPISNNYSQALNNGQITSTETTAGIITNMDISTRTQVHLNDDDNDWITFEFELELTDSEVATNGSIHDISFAVQFGLDIIVAQQAIRVVWDGSEQIVLKTNHTVNNSTVYNAGDTIALSVDIKHDVMSRAEAHQVDVAWYFAPFMKLVSYSSSLSPSSVNSRATSLILKLPSILFVDVISLEVVLEVRSNVSTPSVSSNVATPVEIIYNLNSHPAQDFSQMVVFYYIVSNYVAVLTTCNKPLGLQSGSIQDCQISGSPSADDTHTPTEARYTIGSGWYPFVHTGPPSKQRYLQVYFADKVRVTEIKLQNALYGGTTASKIQPAYSNDGKSWVEGHVLNPDNLYQNPLLISEPQTSRYFRLYIKSNHGQESDMIGLRMELFGCIKENFTGDVCGSVVREKAPAAEYFERQGLATDDNFYYCDFKAVRDGFGEMTPYCVMSDVASQGLTWTAMDENVGTVIGHDPTNGQFFGLATDKESYLTSFDASTWYSIPAHEWEQRKNSANMVKPVKIPLTNDSRLLGSTPHLDFKFKNKWGVVEDGISYYDSSNWNKVLDWSKSCNAQP